MPRKPNTAKSNYNAPFPVALRTLIEEHGLIQDELTEVLGVKSRQSVTGYLDGSTVPTAEKIASVARFFNVSADWLLGLSDMRNPDQSLQGVRAVTGLSDRAIENLCRIKGTESSVGLNILLSSIILEALCYDIAELEDSCKGYFSEDNSQIDQAKKSFPQFAILSGYDLVEYKRQQITERFSHLIMMETNYQSVEYDVVERMSGNITGVEEADDNGQHTED